MRKSLYDILDRWTLFFDRGDIEITLNDVSSQFYKQRVVFLLLEDFWNVLERFDDPAEFMTEDRAMILFEQLLRNQHKEQVAKFIELEISGPPDYKFTVLNVDETIARFPEWFEEYDGMTWDDFTSKLFDN